MKRIIKTLVPLLLALCLLCGAALGEEFVSRREKVTFLLLCNEGMDNDGGNVGNTMMAVSFDPHVGNVRLLMFTWDTFIRYEGFDVPQLIDQPYRQNGPEETLKVFNDNFSQDIRLFLSVNYLSLANLIDNYGGVDVDITRAERNALNGMVGSKKEQVQNMVRTGLLEQLLVENLAKEYYLEDWGPETHLNGLQAVGYGWLQYDSVYNCCLREVKVISNLFDSVGKTVASEVAFYTNDTDLPDGRDGRRAINLDDMTQEDEDYLYWLVQPIFDNSYNNLSHEDIVSISIAVAKTAYLAARQGYNVFGNVEYAVLPLEVLNEYDLVAGRKGHLIDYEANAAAIEAFLYGEDE